MEVKDNRRARIAVRILVWGVYRLRSIHAVMMAARIHIEGESQVGGNVWFIGLYLVVPEREYTVVKFKK